jgi:hypothetical protein
MNGLTFEVRTPVTTADPNRADVACFVGFAAPRGGRPVPDPLARWLREERWIAADRVRTDDLAGLPVPVESWAAFDDLFAWDDRDPAVPGSGTYLGAAVRSFFAQGGARCYAVAVGTPWEFRTARVGRVARVADLLPGFPADVRPTPLDRGTWRGAGCLFGLPEVSYLALPDLADAFATGPRGLPAEETPPGEPEQFVECSVPAAPAATKSRTGGLRAPTLDAAAFAEWAAAVGWVTRLFRRRPREMGEVQLVAAVPLPQPGAVDESSPMPLLGDPATGPLTGDRADPRVQLVYPWVRTPGSANLPAELESPEGVFAGVLARNALTRGAFRSAAGLPLGDVVEVFPRLGAGPMWRRPQNGLALGEAVSLLGPTPAGLQVLSDATASAAAEDRPGAVRRLIHLVRRAARRLGEELTFEPSGERLWGQVRERLGGLGAALLQLGALRGATPEEAFDVRCGRDTMTQSDLDAGRVVATVALAPAAPVERIVVVLDLRGGRAELAPPGVSLGAVA